jgi:hypothetical protein
MKIRSRPGTFEIEDYQVIGDGDNFLALTDDQLRLVTALVCHCRLGQASIFSVAAMDLIGGLGEALGDDWMSDATDRVDLNITVGDNTGVLFRSMTPLHDIILEV